MPDFSTILQTPEIRALTQENILERAFHDALFPRLLFRGEATPQIWPNNVGDTMVFTAAGLIKPKQRPLVPGQDPTPSTWASEQWNAQLQQYADTVDTHMPTSITAIADLFLRNAHQLGLAAGQTLNRIPRNRMYNAALSGHTVVDGTQSTSTSVRVKRLNGLTTSRRPDLPNGSPVRFDPVSANNPLTITIDGTPASVVGFTADNAGDEVGPGVLTLAAVSGGVTDRDAVLSSDRTFLVRVGGGDAIDAVGSSDLLKLSDIRAAVSRFRGQNVPEHPDMRYHCHLDPTSESQIFADTEWQRLLTSLPDYYMYKQFAIGELLGCVYFRNSENPLPDTIEGGLTGIFTEDDPFGGELTNDGAPPSASNVTVHRPLFTAQGGLYEYYQDLGQLITEAGVTGRVGEPAVVNNGIEVNTDRIQLLIRAPLNRLQDLVAASWKFIGDWPVRTDVTSGDDARFKRMLTIEHGA